MIINKLTSTFGDHSSLLPLFTKDVINSIGVTAFSYDAGGKIEAKDKLIDEFGTQAIWLGGLPFFKFITDKTIYKLANINPDIDPRLIKDKLQLEVAQKFAKNLTDRADISKTLEHAVNNAGKTKALFLGKFALATVLTMASYFTLVKTKQHYTKKQIEKQYWAKKSEEQFYNNKVATSPAFKAFMNSDGVKNSASKSVSFKGIGSALSNFMYNPVWNLSIIDGGISGERLLSSRTKTERAEIAIKEGSFLFFMYFAGKLVQQGIEWVGSKFKKPIELTAEVLSSKELHSSIKSGQVYNDVQVIKNLAADKKAFFEFIYDAKNADNIVINAAKQSGMIKTIVDGNFIQKFFGKGVDTGIVDPHQYIDFNEIQKLSDNLKKIVDMSPKSGLSKFLNSCRNIKILSVAANMGITCLALGVIVPYAMFKYRAHKQEGNKDFHVKTEIENQLEKSFKGRLA